MGTIPGMDKFNPVFKSLLNKTTSHTFRKLKPWSQFQVTIKAVNNDGLSGLNSNKFVNTEESSRTFFYYFSYNGHLHREMPQMAVENSSHRGANNSYARRRSLRALMLFAALWLNELECNMIPNENVAMQNVTSYFYIIDVSIKDLRSKRPLCYSTTESESNDERTL